MYLTPQELKEAMNFELGADKKLLGEAVSIYRRSLTEELPEPIVGYVIKFKGSVREERSSQLEIRTPHGSVVETGRGYVRIANEEDLARLNEYEKDARERDSCKKTNSHNN